MIFRFCPACSLFVLSCSHFKETTVSDQTTPPEAEDAAPKRGISSLSPDLQALAKIDRILADLDPLAATRVLTFLTDKTHDRVREEELRDAAADIYGD